MTGRAHAYYTFAVRSLELMKLLWLAYRAWRGDVRASLRLVLYAKKICPIPDQVNKATEPTVTSNAAAYASGMIRVIPPKES